MIRSLNFNVAPLLGVLAAAPAHADLADEHIRRVVGELLREKDQKIEQLEARIRQLERQRGGNLAESARAVSSENPAVSSAAKPENSANSADGQLRALDKKIEEIKAAADKGLQIGGFFDVNAKTGNATDQTFSIGLLELDVAYNYNEHLAASSALVLCGNSSGADYASTPAHIACGNSSLIGSGGGSAAIGVGLIDFHWFDGAIPPRGRIFGNQGFHIQAGRFDLPFSADYQNFANKDRVSITAPITTVRIQKGGFNGDGVRSYGSWGMFNYSAFWTNGVYQSEGTSVGGRLGMQFGQNVFRIHGANPEGIEFGVSHLWESDGRNEVRNTFYAADLGLGYGALRLQNEFLLQQGHQATAQYRAGGLYGLGKSRQIGYHSTLIADFAGVVGRPLSAFARYGRWRANWHYAVDGYGDNAVVAIAPISQLSLGMNYKYSEHLRLKFEYTDSLGTATGEHYFDKRLGMAQMIVAF